MHRYIWACLKRAFNRAPGIIDFWTGVVTAVLGIVANYIPEANALMVGSGWMVPVWVLAAIMGLRLVLSPYWVWRDDQETIARLRVPDRSQRIAEIKNSIGRFLNAGKEIQIRTAKTEDPPPSQEAEKWAADVIDFLETTKELGVSYSARFTNFSGLSRHGAMRSPEHDKVAARMYFHTIRLHEFLRELQ